MADAVSIPVVVLGLLPLLLPQLRSSSGKETLPDMSDPTSDAPLFKILGREAWAAADGCVPWAPIDRSDGFVHLSAAHQVEETAAKHFADRGDLVLVEVLPDRLSEGTLRWEVSRGGDRFPHVYGDIPLDAVGRTVEFSTQPGALFPRALLQPAR